MAVQPNEQPRGDILMEWEFPEFVNHERSRSWYVWFMFVVFGLIAYSIWAAAFTFTALIVLASFILILRLRRQPPNIRFQIREEGLEVGERFYAWKELHEYWIVFEPPQVKKLYFEFKSRVRPSLEIGLMDQNPLKIRQLLNEYLLENTKREEEPLSDQWSRMLKI